MFVPTVTPDADVAPDTDIFVIVVNDTPKSATPPLVPATVAVIVWPPQTVPVAVKAMPRSLPPDVTMTRRGVSSMATPPDTSVPFSVSLAAPAAVWD